MAARPPAPRSALTAIVERQLADEPGHGRSPTALDAFTLARRQFGRGERVELANLAAELGVSRPTIYRWVGGRKQLIAEILWFYGHLALREGARDAERSNATGTERIAMILRRLVVNTSSFEPLQSLLRAEPENALRILTTKHAPVQRRVVEFLASALHEEVGARRIALPEGLSAEDLAYALLRTCETFVYADVIAGEQPSVEKAEQVLRLTLGGLPPAPS